MRRLTFNVLESRKGLGTLKFKFRQNGQSAVEYLKSFGRP